VKSLKKPAGVKIASFGLVLSWAGLCAGIVAAPLLAAGSHSLPGGLLYLSFAQVCHQIPERSFFLRGHPIAVCHRCAGIYFGLLLGSLLGGKIFLFVLEPSRRRWWVAACVVPLAVDALAPATGLWANTMLTRSATGALFGIMVSSLLKAAAAELFDPGRHREPAASQPHGGSS
jgi:uncharacterized membrane protein